MLPLPKKTISTFVKSTFRYTSTPKEEPVWPRQKIWAYIAGGTFGMVYAGYTLTTYVPVLSFFLEQAVNDVQHAAQLGELSLRWPRAVGTVVGFHEVPYYDGVSCLRLM